MARNGFSVAPDHRKFHIKSFQGVEKDPNNLSLIMPYDFIKDSQSLTYKPWHTNEPNGGDGEMYVASFANTGKWWDISESRPLQFICQKDL